MSIGRESRDEWASRNVDAMWGCAVNPSPKDSCKVTEATRLWYEKFLRLEGFPLETLGGAFTTATSQGIPKLLTPKRKLITTGIQEYAKRQKLLSSQTVAHPLRALGLMTNVPHEDTMNRRQGQGQGQGQGDTSTALPSTSVVLATLSNEQCDFSRGKADKSVKYNIITATPITPMSPDPKYIFHRDVVTSTPFSSKSTNNSHPQILAIPNGPSLPRSLQISETVITSKFCKEDDSRETSTNSLPIQIPEPSWPEHYVDTAIVQFIRDSYVWIYREVNNKRPADRPPASHLVPQHRRIGVIYFLLIICGCNIEVGKNVYCRKSDQFTHVNKCVMFVKTGNDPEVQEGLNWLFRALDSWRVDLNKPGNKELFVFDSQMITYTSLSTFRGDVASKALWRSGSYKEN